MPKFQFYLEFLHATWPAYPAAHGRGPALETLCLFPPGTHFDVVDDIDRCLLLVAREYLDRGAAGDKYSEKHFHVAIWHDDLRALRDDGSLAGLSLPPASPEETRQEAEAWVRSMPSADSVLKEYAALDWEAIWRKTVSKDELHVQSDGLSVSVAGWGALREVVRDHGVDPYFAERVEPLLNIGYFDSAVREASILLEESLRSRLRSTQHGQALVGAYVDAHAALNEAFMLHLRTELRTLFKFVRNDFAHNLVMLERPRCDTFLRRISAVYEMLNMADAAMARGSK